MSANNATDCCNYIMNYVDDTPCRKKILELTEWIFSFHNNIKWYTREKGKSVAFFLKTQGHDHFAIFKLQKKCTQMDLYIRRQPTLPSYLTKYPDNQDWARISGENFSGISKDELQKHILNSYHLRLDELGIAIDKGSPSSFVMADPITNEENDPTIEEFENFLRSSSQNRKVSIDDAFDAFEQQYTEKTRSLKSGWRKRLEEKLSQSKRIKV